MANDVDICNGISKALDNCVVKVQASEDKDASHEYLRKKLWGDALVMAMSPSVQNMDVVKVADAALAAFDKRFGKGDGE